MDREKINELVQEKKKYKYVTRSVTLPYWLNEAAKASGINVSGLLQEALMNKLEKINNNICKK